MKKTYKFNASEVRQKLNEINLLVQQGNHVELSKNNVTYGVIIPYSEYLKYMENAKNESK